MSDVATHHARVGSARERTAGAHAVLRHHSKSFALAAKFLPAAIRDDVAVLYAWCRRVDDAVDEVPSREAVRAIPRLLAEVDALYDERPIEHDALLLAMRRVVRRHRIPRTYPLELVRGMEMDARRITYADLGQLRLYCWRVASTVGLMVCRVMGIDSPDALRRAAQLGIAMQLTNVCRDVAEDWNRGRLYLPASMMTEPPSPHGPTRPGPVVATLLAEADRLYRASDLGIAQLPFRCRVAVRTARLVYHAIGEVIAERGFDVMAGRAYVGTLRKVWLAGVALAQSVVEVFRRDRSHGPILPSIHEVSP